MCLGGVHPSQIDKYRSIVCAEVYNEPRGQLFKVFRSGTRDAQKSRAGRARSADYRLAGFFTLGFIEMVCLVEESIEDSCVFEQC